ncbi:MAG: non-heme iron oxygenase ferredoxin subunit [Pseudomonadota bacterium]
MGFVQACAKAEVEPDRPFLYEWDGDPIAVCVVDNEYFAVDDTCTHDRWSLCDGYVEDGEIVCTLHMARFCVRTGAVRTPPAYEPLKVYPVKVEGEFVLIDPEAGTYADE